MKLDVILLALASVTYTVGLAVFNVGGQQLSGVAYLVAFAGTFLLGAITLLVTRSLRRDLRELKGESA